MMKSSWLLHRGPEFALRRRGSVEFVAGGVRLKARASSSVCGTNFANADRMFDSRVRLRLTRKPGHPTALPPTTASTGRDRQLVAQGITEQIRSKYPNICPKWTDRRPCERGTPEPSKTPMLGQWSCAARRSTGPASYDLTAKNSSHVDPYCGASLVFRHAMEPRLRATSESLVISELAHASVSSILRVAQRRADRFRSR
jgi:hypothetical protein